MPRKSTRSNKTIYQISREKAGLTREAASEKMSFMSEDRIENIESGRTTPQPEDILEMARVYSDPLLCNSFCSTQCPIGKKYVPTISKKELSQITLEVLNNINALYKSKDQLVSITVDGEISNHEVEDFSKIYDHLKQLSIASTALQLWLETRL